MRRFMSPKIVSLDELHVDGIQVEEFDDPHFAAKVCVNVRQKNGGESTTLVFELAALDALRVGVLLEEVAKKRLIQARLERDKRILNMDEAKRHLVLWLSQKGWFTDQEKERNWLMEQIIRFQYSPDGKKHDILIPIPEHTRLGQELLELEPGELALDYFRVDEGL